MRKVKLQMQISLDGYVAGTNGEMDWMTWNWDAALSQYVTEITNPVDCIVLGRVLAQGFIPHWAAAANSSESEDFTHKMNDTAKVVFSKTLDTNEWKNTILAKDISTEITRLKNQTGGDIIVYGGSNLVSNLIQANLIDEYHFFINPVILGKGMPIFQALTAKQNLTLIHSKSFACGIVVLCYTPTMR